MERQPLKYIKEKLKKFVRVDNSKPRPFSPITELEGYIDAMARRSEPPAVRPPDDWLRSNNGVFKAR